MKYSFPKKPQTWQIYLFLILGIIIFLSTSNLELNYFLRNYLLIMEIQGGILGVYLLSSLMKKRKLKGTKNNLNHR